MEDYMEECFYCGEEFPQDEMTMVFDYYVCEHCLDEYMQQCDMCDEYWDSTGADWHTVIVDGEEKTICPECFDNYYSYNNIFFFQTFCFPPLFLLYENFRHLLLFIQIKWTKLLKEGILL